MGENGVCTQSVYINTSATTFVSSCTMEVWIGQLLPPLHLCCLWGSRVLSRIVKSGVFGRESRGKKGIYLMCVYMYICVPSAVLYSLGTQTGRYLMNQSSRCITISSSPFPLLPVWAIPFRVAQDF